MLLSDYGERFAPVVDLGALALGLAAVLEEDGGYAVTDITAATDLPGVWLGGDTSGTDGLSGCMTVRAQPSGAGRDHFLMVFLAEAASTPDATAIAGAAEVGALAHAVRLGLAAGRLAAVVVATSGVHEVAPIKDAGSLTRFRPGIGALLSRAAGPEARPSGAADQRSGGDPALGAGRQARAKRRVTPRRGGWRWGGRGRGGRRCR